MIQLLLVTHNKDAFSELASILEMRDDTLFSWAESGENALLIVSEIPFDLVVTDEDVGDMTGLELIRKLMVVNPMINCATLNALPPEEFHEATEGLGIMAQLPTQPNITDAEKMLSRLREIKSLEAEVFDSL